MIRDQTDSRACGESPSREGGTVASTARRNKVSSEPSVLAVAGELADTRRRTA
jgi:hypothetical protein